MTKQTINQESTIIIYRHLNYLLSEYETRVNDFEKRAIAMEESDFAETAEGNKQIENLYDQMEISEAVANKVEALIDLFERFM